MCKVHFTTLELELSGVQGRVKYKFASKILTRDLRSCLCQIKAVVYGSYGSAC